MTSPSLARLNALPEGTGLIGIILKISIAMLRDLTCGNITDVMVIGGLVS